MLISVRGCQVSLLFLRAFLLSCLCLAGEAYAQERNDTESAKPGLSNTSFGFEKAGSPKEAAAEKEVSAAGEASAAKESSAAKEAVNEKESADLKKEEELCHKLLPYGKLYSDSEMGFRFKRAFVEPLDDRKLAFELFLPKDWLPKAIQLSKEDLANDTHTQIPLFVISPMAKKPEAVIQVRYMRVPEHLSPAQFLEIYARKSSAEIVCRQHADLKSGRVDDALLRLKIDEMGDALMRISICRRNDLLFFIACSCPEKQYEIWKNTFAVSAVSFSPNSE